MANSTRVRHMNSELIREVLKKLASGTKNSIAAATGLSVATCGNILRQMLRSGEVLEIEAAESTGGRPSRQFVYNVDYRNAAIMYARREAGVDSLYCAVVNLVGRRVYEKRTSGREINQVVLQSAVTEMVTLFPRIKSLCIGIPGVVHEGEIGICDFPALSRLGLKNSLQNLFKRNIVVENDVNCTAFGYYHAKADLQAEGIVYIYYPENGNPGAGIIINGRILRGSTDFAGEVSFLPLGVDAAEQGKIQKDTDAFLDLVTRTILCIHTIVNPGTIVLSGRCFSEGFRVLLVRRVAELSIGEHAPRILFEDDIHESYVEGLTALALEKMKG